MQRIMKKQLERKKQKEKDTNAKKQAKERVQKIDRLSLETDLLKTIRDLNKVRCEICFKYFKSVKALNLHVSKSHPLDKWAKRKKKK